MTGFLDMLESDMLRSHSVGLASCTLLDATHLVPLM